MLRLSREKIINTEKMKSFGDDAGAEQLGKLYDYLIEQRTAENDLAFAQREFEKAEVKWAADEEKLKSISDSLAKLSTRLASSENAWKKVGQEIAMATAEVEDESIKNSMADKISKARLKEYQAAQKAYKKIKEQYDKQLDVLNLNETEENTLLQQYENTRMKADLRLYERSKDYNDFLTENGDVIQSNRDWLKNERWAPQKVTDFYNDLVEDVSESIKEMNQTYEDKFYTTETYQAKIADNTANLAEKLDMLLQMK